MKSMPRKILPQEEIKDLGDRLRLLRKSKGWTQADLAQHAGIERSMVGNYELGLHYPPIPTLIKLASALEITVDRLLGLEENKAADIQDRRLHQLFLEVDQADFATQGLIKQVVESLLLTNRRPQPKTGTKG